MKIEVAPLLLHQTASLYDNLPWENVATLAANTPWSERPTVSIEVPTNETRYFEVLETAVQEIGLNIRDIWGERFQASHSAEYEGLIFADTQTSLPIKLDAIVTADGSLTWRFSNSKVSIEDLFRTAKQGVVSATPHRIFIPVTEPPEWGVGGNGIDQVFEFLRAAQELVPYVQATLSVLGVKTVMDVLKFKKYWNKWAPLGGDARSLLHVTRTPKTTGEAAALLQTSIEDTPTILTFLGMSQDNAGTWSSSHDPEKQMLREIAEILGISSHRRLPIGRLSVAMQEIMTKPAGTRAEVADSILAKHQLMTESEGSFRMYFFRSPERDNVTHGRTYDRDGRHAEFEVDLVEVEPNIIEVHDPRSGALLNPEGKAYQFPSLDRAMIFSEELLSRLEGKKL